MFSVLTILLAFSAFHLHQASVVSNVGTDTTSLSANWNGALVLRGVVNNNDPTALIDDFSILASDIITSFAPSTSSIRMFKTGINTGAVAFEQVALHSNFQIYTAETDFELISWHATRASLLSSDVASRAHAIGGKPYNFLNAFNQAQFKHQVLFQDIYDGDTAEQSGYSTQQFYAIITASLDLPSYPLVIRHLYGADLATIQQTAADMKTYLFNSALILSLSQTPAHTLIMSSSLALSCAAFAQDVSMTSPPVAYSCVEA